MRRTEIRNESIASQVYKILKEQVIGGKYSPGDKISEQTLADDLGVSRVPVREAIRQLANEGMIDFIPNRGAYAKTYTQKNISDSFAVRLLFERYAIENIDENLRQQYREEMKRLKERICAASREEYSAMDEELHEMIIRLSGNEALMSLYRLLYSQILLFREISLLDEKMYQLATLFHIRVLDALIDGDDKHALSIATKHLLESEKQVKKYYLKQQI